MDLGKVANAVSEKPYNYTISIIRFIALLLIITCHMMQHESCFLAWWFNVGVQIFLCISGYLYGQKKISDIPKFYADRFKKILIPYYLVFLTAGIAEFIFARECFNVFRFCGGLVCRTTIIGGEHLWFVSTILFCYILTPLLYFYKVKYVKTYRSFWIGTFAACCAVTVYCGLYDRFFNPAWICCFVLGYALGVNEEQKYAEKSHSEQSEYIYITAFLAVLGNALQIYLSNHYVFTGIKEKAFTYFSNYNHVWLGIFLFLLMKKIFEKVDYINHPGLIKCLKITDKYSYETYLVHQFLILGPFSLMAITPFLFINCSIIIIGIIILAWLLKTSEKPIFGWLGRFIPSSPSTENVSDTSKTF